MKPTTVLCCLVLLVPVLFLTGCGRGGPGDTPDLGEVSGTVTLDGEPLAGALVTFQPESGRPSTAETDAGGNYTLGYSTTEMGAKVGIHAVRISKMVSSTAGKDGETLENEVLPAKYNADSELTEEVKPGSQTIDFPLKTE